MPEPNAKQPIELPKSVDPDWKKFQAPAEKQQKANTLSNQIADLEELIEKKKRNLQQYKFQIKQASRTMGGSDTEEMKVLYQKIANIEKNINDAETKLRAMQLAHRDKEHERDEMLDVFDDRVIKFAQLISKNCKQALAAYQKADMFLYRGVTGADDRKPAFMSYPRSDRQPKDTATHLHNDFDRIMSQVFMATRSTSIFCTSNRREAGNYGSVYLIFPLDGFNFTWTSMFSDLTVDLFERGRSMDGLIIQAYGLEEHLSDVYASMEHVVDAIGDMEFGTEPLPLQDIDYKQKVYTGLQTYMREFDGRHLPTQETIYNIEKLLEPMEMTDWMGADIANIVEGARHMYHALLPYDDPEEAANLLKNYWGFKNTNFAEAVFSGHEVLIRGNYYAFEYDRFYYPLSMMLLGSARND